MTLLTDQNIKTLVGLIKNEPHNFKNYGNDLLCYADSFYIGNYAEPESLIIILDGITLSPHKGTLDPKQCEEISKAAVELIVGRLRSKLDKFSRPQTNTNTYTVIKV